MRELLAPKPFRGDQVAAGTVVLTVLVLLLNVRFAGRWDTGWHLGYTASGAGLVLGMALAAPREPAGPPPWHSTLYVSAFLLSGAALGWLADALGSHGGSGTLVWAGGVLTALGAWLAHVRGSATTTLLAAVTAVITSLALLDWALSPDGVSAFRYLLLADTALLVLAALWQRIRNPVHGVQLLNAVGLTLLAIAATFAFGSVAGLLFGAPGDGSSHVAWGWTLLLLTGGIGVLSAGAADDERGNVFVGVLLLLAFVALATDGDLLGWPIILGASAAALLVIGLRPSTPLPGPPPEHL